MIAVEGSVALLAEGVDRNRKPQLLADLALVALLAEGVDRNSAREVARAALRGRPPPGWRG